jgi:hypothetical protein
MAGCIEAMVDECRQPIELKPTIHRQKGSKHSKIGGIRSIDDLQEGGATCVGVERKAKCRREVGDAEATSHSGTLVTDRYLHPASRGRASRRQVAVQNNWLCSYAK